MYVKYRVGGGSQTNIGANTITNFGNINISITGPDSSTNAIVQSSLTVTNITPAIGGGDAPSIEEIRNYISYNFASQDRAVTLNDYKAILLGMPSKFGTPSRVGVRQNQNKIEINPISYDSTGAFSGQITSVILDNIATYLSEYRMINDYVIVNPGQVIDLGFEISVVVDSTSQLSTITQIIQNVSDEFTQSTQQMGQSYYVFNLTKAISNIQGVLNVNYIKAFNKTSVGYSSDVIDQNILDTTTGEIDLSSGIINCDANQILQVRNPGVDIVVIPIVSNQITSLV
jgi:hypothetical protein